MKALSQVMDPRARGSPMDEPQRIQLKRTRGWRKPEGAVVVSRPSKWGNEFRALRVGVGLYAVCSRVPREWDPCFQSYEAALKHATDCFRRALLDDWLDFSVKDVRRELRGKSLCCWCPLGHPCHADVLLSVANGGAQ